MVRTRCARRGTCVIFWARGMPKKRDATDHVSILSHITSIPLSLTTMFSPPPSGLACNNVSHEVPSLGLDFALSESLWS